MTFLKFIYNILGGYSYFILIAGLILSAVYLKKLQSLYKGLAVYLIIMLVCDMFTKTIWRFMGNNYLALQLYSFAELAFMLYFYKSFMLMRWQKIFTYLGVAALAYIVGETIWLYGFNTITTQQYQVYSKVADNFVIILLALTFLHERMSSFREKKWGSFSINIVFLVYFTLDTLFFLPFNFMITAGDIMYYFWAGHIIMLIVFYLYLVFEILKNAQKDTLFFEGFERG